MNEKKAFFLTGTFFWISCTLLLLLEKSIDSKFDRFELYCLKNIFSFPKDLNVVLPHYQVPLYIFIQGYDMNVTMEEEEQLDLKIDQLRAQRVAVIY